MVSQSESHGNLQSTTKHVNPSTSEGETLRSRTVIYQTACFDDDADQRQTSMLDADWLSEHANYGVITGCVYIPKSIKCAFNINLVHENRVDFG